MCTGAEVKRSRPDVGAGGLVRAQLARVHVEDAVARVEGVTGDECGGVARLDHWHDRRGRVERDDHPEPVQPQHPADLVGHRRHRLLAALVDAQQRVERALVDAHVHARRAQPKPCAVHHGVAHLGPGRAAELALPEHALLAEVDGDLVPEAVVVQGLREAADAAAGMQHRRPRRACTAQHVHQLGIAGKPLDVLVLGRQGVGLPELPRAEIGCRHLRSGDERGSDPAQVWPGARRGALVCPATAWNLQVPRRGAQAWWPEAAVIDGRADRNGAGAWRSHRRARSAGQQPHRAAPECLQSFWTPPPTSTPRRPPCWAPRQVGHHRRRRRRRRSRWRR